MGGESHCQRQDKLFFYSSRKVCQCPQQIFDIVTYISANRALTQVCDEYEAEWEVELCLQYNSLINNDVTSVPGMKAGEKFKQTSVGSSTRPIDCIKYLTKHLSVQYTKQQLKIGITPQLLCTDLRQCGCCLAPEKPEQVHLAIFNETTYSVMWTTGGENT